MVCVSTPLCTTFFNDGGVHAKLIVSLLERWKGGEHLPRTRQYGNRLSLDDRVLHFHSPAPASLAVNRRMETSGDGVFLERGLSFGLKNYGQCGYFLYPARVQYYPRAAGRGRPARGISNF